MAAVSVEPAIIRSSVLRSDVLKLKYKVLKRKYMYEKKTTVVPENCDAVMLVVLPEIRCTKGAGVRDGVV